jgi:hypothetical protein
VIVCVKVSVIVYVIVYVKALDVSIDVDECAGVNDCQQLCENTVGSYSCSCNIGFTLQADGRNCTGIIKNGGMSIATYNIV